MCVSLFAMSEQIICTHMLQKQMKGLTVIVMTEMTQLMKKDIVP
jgi:hypothetical protein